MVCINLGVHGDFLAKVQWLRKVTVTLVNTMNEGKHNIPYSEYKCYRSYNFHFTSFTLIIYVDIISR